MRPPLILFAACLTAAAPAFAQVTVDLHALQALPDHPTPAHPSHPPPSVALGKPSVAVNNPPVVQGKPPVATQEPAPTPPAPQPAMPENVPQTAAINPIAPPEPSAGAPPPPPPPVSEKAATTAAATTAGLRLTFAPEQSDLSPSSIDSVKQLTASAPPGDETTFNVQAYAPGKPDDPSTARRVSLSRAMAVRSALVADGVPSARIFVRALGEQYGDGPPDRVDIGVNAASSAAVAR
jgi:outer membrane protein OmpA-like peptidoglycan-associated protein